MMGVVKHDLVWYGTWGFLVFVLLKYSAYRGATPTPELGGRGRVGRYYPRSRKA
jgi:hypothetical protein